MLNVIYIYVMLKLGILKIIGFHLEEKKKTVIIFF